MLVYTDDGFTKLPDGEGWAVEYKMKDAQGRLLGYQWLSSITSTPLCVDVLLAAQGE